MNPKKQEQNNLEIQSEVQPELETKKSKTWLWILIGVLVAAVLVGWVVWTYQKTINETEKLALEQKVLNLQKQVQEDETADWQTYKNEEYGFEIKYHPYWESAGIGLINENSNNIDLLVLNNKSYKKQDNNAFPVLSFNLLNSFDEIENGVGILVENKKIDNKSIGIYKEETYFGDKYTAVIGLQDDKFFMIHVCQIENRNESLEVFNQILSTFRFLEDGDDILNCQTYRNEEYGFEFEYPAKYFAKENTDGSVVISIYDFDDPKRASSLGLMGTMSIFINTKEQLSDIIFNIESQGYEDFKKSKVLFDTTEGTLITYIGAYAGEKHFNYFIEKNNSVYEIFYSHEPTFGKIVESFKFLN